MWGDSAEQMLLEHFSVGIPGARRGRRDDAAAQDERVTEERRQAAIRTGAAFDTSHVTAENVRAGLETENVGVVKVTILDPTDEDPTGEHADGDGKAEPARTDERRAPAGSALPLPTTLKRRHKKANPVMPAPPVTAHPDDMLEPDHEALRQLEGEGGSSARLPKYSSLDRDTAAELEVSAGGAEGLVGQVQMDADSRRQLLKKSKGDLDKLVTARIRLRLSGSLPENGCMGCSSPSKRSFDGTRTPGTRQSSGHRWFARSAVTSSGHTRSVESGRLATNKGASLITSVCSVWRSAKNC
jgi:hypothetical protein